MCNQEKIEYDRLSSLSEYGACKKRRTFKGVLGDSIKSSVPTGTFYKRAEICADTIQQALRYNEREDRNIMEYMNSRYIEAGFLNPQQKMQVLLADWRRVMRYLRDEHRVPSFFAKRLVSVSDQLKPIMVAPHAAFVSKGIDGEDRVEFVYYKTGKPNVTQKGNKNAMKRDLQLYATILYGRQMGFKNITASFYFLKKDTDTQTWNLNEQSFFGSGNIVSLEGDYMGNTAEIDTYMSPIIQKFIDGVGEEEQLEENCKFCEFFNICKYKKAPITIKDEEE